MLCWHLAIGSRNLEQSLVAFWTEMNRMLVSIVIRTYPQKCSFSFRSWGCIVYTRLTSHREIVIKSNRNQIVFTIFDWFGTKQTSDWFGTKQTLVWFQIIHKVLNTIWFRVDLIRFLCVCLIGWIHTLSLFYHQNTITVEIFGYFLLIARTSSSSN